MSTLRQRFAALNGRLPHWVWPLVVIVAAVLLGNGMYTFGLADNNPIAWTANIAHSLCRITCGRPAIDPNLGFLTQPLGHVAALDLVHGHLPWWNYFEGLGQPLAGEMQGAALFPLTVLFALPNGLYLFHVSLEIIAGLSTYFLGRRLGMGGVVATSIAIVFALNGTYAWLGNATLNPVAFAPMMALGVEMIYDGVQGRARGGWYVLAIGLALSLYAGFPEVAYFNGVLVLVWAIVRLWSVPAARRWAATGGVALGGVVGLLLSAPLLVAFADFLKLAHIGNHTAGGFATAHLSPQALPMLIDPYIYGTIFYNPAAIPSWGAVGGYLTTGIVAFALVGLFGRRARALRITLGLWSILGISAIFGYAHAHELFNLLPGVKSIALLRYFLPSVELAAIVLAGFGLSDLRTSVWARRLAPLAVAGTAIVTALAAEGGAPTNNGVVLGHRERIIYLGLHALPFIALFLYLVFTALARYRPFRVLLAIVLAGEALLLYFVPTAEAPKKIIVDQPAITFLQQHLGTQRFLDFAVLNANWGSQYGLSSLSAIDLPFPSTFATYIATQLYPSKVHPRQFIIQGGMTGIKEQEQMVVDHLSAYQESSVKYLLINNKVPLLPALAKIGVTLVFRDGLASIYQVPGAQPLFTATKGCQVTSTTYDHATVTCSTPGTLTRSELVMKGWHATVNGTAAPIGTSEGTFQTVALPAGTSTVAFSFLPPHEEAAIGAFLLGILAMILWPVAGSLRRHRRARHAA